MTDTAIMTQQQIADELGISRVAVYQIELRAIKKIKLALKKRKIKLDDLLP